ncbi:MAG: hypothetical protein NZM37_10995, partial [Sandaracinaceae bacterium]|nr:hypothetical protein [Sandaracinaceae bacterium]
MAQTIIDFDYEAAGLGFVGEVGNDGTSGGYAIPRIRWVIDEQALYAYRDYRTVSEAADPYADERQGDPRFLGQPVAAYRILGHFDIRRVYNSTTGEEQNIIVENATDRKWWERRFMRVDFSRNLIASRAGISADLQALFGQVRREPADIAVWSRSDMPPEWMPQFHYMSCDSPDSPKCASEGDRIFAGDYPVGQLYHFSFVTIELLSPGVINDPVYGLVPYCGEAALGMPECASVPIAVRTSFLRVSNTREYEPEQWQDERFERAGYFRLERDTYDSTHDAGDPGWGRTDFRNLAMFRHNIWRNWYDEEALDVSCGSNIDCVEAAGPNARCKEGRCVRRRPVDYKDRGVRRIIWHTSPELPAHLVRPAFETVSEWNRVLMEVVRVRTGRPLPEYPPVPCQRENPDGYCYCTEIPVAGRPGCNLDDPSTWDRCEKRLINPECPGQYDPFVPPSVAMERGVVNPFDCYVAVRQGAEPDPADAGKMARLQDQDFEGWFEAKMVGSECVIELRVN